MIDSAPAFVDRLLANPPAVHAMDASDEPELGVWSTERDCYLLLAEHAGPGARTLETGSGLSTIVLTAIGACHTCITPSQEEADRIAAYCKEQGIDTSALTFEIGCSDDVLPSFSREPLDLVLIDGNHGFPVPMIDWYYAGSRVRQNGVLVLDDIQLPAVAHVRRFVDADPRWAVLRSTDKWVAYRRVTDGDLRQDWYSQPFYSAEPPLRLGDLATRALRKIQRAVHSRVRSRH